MSVEEELNWRLEQYRELQQHPNWPIIPNAEINERKIYFGGRGIWFDKTRTEKIIPGGIAVGLLHTGHHYPDDVSESSILYHYPETETVGRDISEVNSIKNAATLKLPIFILVNVSGGKRVMLSWVEAVEDKLGYVLLSFERLNKPAEINRKWEDPNSPLVLKISRPKIESAFIRARRDPKFKFHTLQRYEGKCAVTNLNITRILEAAHIVPVEDGGSDDPRNGILLSPNAHRAFDAGMWTIHPKTLEIVESEKHKEFEVLKNLKFEKTNIKDLINKPAQEALDFRYDLFQQAN
jgi:hypothetical protein